VRCALLEVRARAEGAFGHAQSCSDVVQELWHGCAQELRLSKKAMEIIPSQLSEVATHPQAGPCSPSSLYFSILGQRASCSRMCSHKILQKSVKGRNSTPDN
jgi:hypothetical protein